MAEKVLNKKEFKDLFEVISSLKTAAEVKDFMRDVATLSELTAMAERLQVASMVEEGVPYREISKKVGSSTATITRVAHWLHHGQGGYRLALERMK